MYEKSNGTPSTKPKEPSKQQFNKDGSPRKKMGRPSKIANIDRSIFENCCKIQCTEEEICCVLDVSICTLEKWIKSEYGDKSFSQVFREKRGAGRASLRRMQFNTAEKGNPTMLIWLGKQYLGQSDTPKCAEDNNVVEDELSKSLRELGKEL